MLTNNHQKLIRFLDTSIKKQRYGSLTLTVVIKASDPLIETARLVKMKRRKYKISKTIDIPPNR